MDVRKGQEEQSVEKRGAVQMVEELVLRPIIPLVADAYEYFSEGKNVGTVSGVNLGAISDGRGNTYKHVPDLNGKEYIIDLADGRERIALPWMKGEVMVKDFAAVYEVRQLQKLEREGIELLVTRVNNAKERENICREFMYLYYTKRI